MSCKEHDLSKIARIEAIKLTDIDISSVPVFSSKLTSESISVDKDSEGNEKVWRIPFQKSSAKLDDAETIAVYGYVHKVTLSWKWQPESADDHAQLITLRNNPHCLRITYFGGQVRYVIVDEATYQFTFADDDGDCKCKMTLINGMGMIKVAKEYDTVDQETKLTPQQTSSLIKQNYPESNANLLGTAVRYNTADRTSYLTYRTDTDNSTDYLFTTMADDGTEYSEEEMDTYWETIKDDVKTKDASTRKLYIGSYACPDGTDHSLVLTQITRLTSLYRVWYGVSTTARLEASDLNGSAAID